jgi:hypothetical protein
MFALFSQTDQKLFLTLGFPIHGVMLMTLHS